MPWTFGAFTVGCLSIIGLPVFGGMWSKWYLLLGALETHQLILAGALIASSLLNILYLLIIPIRAFFAAPAEGVPTGGIHEAPLPQVLAMVICSIATIGLFFWPDPLFRLAQMLVP
jgi:multicomponent Na+:H+ antiporter subunit D